MPQMPYNEYGLLIAQAQFMAPVSSLTQQGSPNRSTRQITCANIDDPMGKGDTIVFKQELTIIKTFRHR